MSSVSSLIERFHCICIRTCMHIQVEIVRIFEVLQVVMPVLLWHFVNSTVKKATNASI